MKLSGTYHRYVLQPNADISKITDATVLAQFEAIMTDRVKLNYQTFLDDQNVKMNPK